MDDLEGGTGVLKAAGWSLATTFNSGLVLKISHVREPIGNIIWIMGFRFTHFWIYTTGVVHMKCIFISFDDEESSHSSQQPNEHLSRLTLVQSNP